MYHSRNITSKCFRSCDSAFFFQCKTIVAYKFTFAFQHHFQYKMIVQNERLSSYAKHSLERYQGYCHGKVTHKSVNNMWFAFIFHLQTRRSNRTKRYRKYQRVERFSSHHSHGENSEVVLSHVAVAISRHSNDFMEVVMV